MSIETLDDIVTELANKLGIYGSCDHEGKEAGCPPDGCRCCFESNLKSRIRDSVEVERTLEAAQISRT